MSQMIGADWPTIRDAVRELGVSDTYVAHLIRERRLSATRTRLVWLIDPKSLATLEAERRARQLKRSA